MADTPTPPELLPPSASHPDHPLASQSTCAVSPTGQLTVLVAAERPCCC